MAPLAIDMALLGQSNACSTAYRAVSGSPHRIQLTYRRKEALASLSYGLPGNRRAVWRNRFVLLLILAQANRTPLRTRRTPNDQP